MRILITGAAGFAGNHLVEEILTTVPGAEIFGLVWTDGRKPPAAVHSIAGDLADQESLSDALAAARPEIVFHLAAASSVASSWSDPEYSLRVNLSGTVKLLEAIREQGSDPRILVASSAEVYGAVPPTDQPISEDTPLRPLSPYAHSKAAQDLATRQYFHQFGLRAIRLRLFHHTGPGRPPIFVASSFAHQIARIERGLDPPRLSVGNLDAVRDFTDVRDVARAYVLAAEHGNAGEVYNICSGLGTSIREVLDLLLEQSSVEVEVQIDPDRLRRSDIPHLVGNPDRFHSATGWRPLIPLRRTLSDLLDWWRANLDRQPDLT